MREPLVMPAVALVAGILLAPNLPAGLGWSFLGAGIVVSLLLGRIRWALVWAPLSLAGLGAGVLLAFPGPPPSPPRLLARSGEKVWIEGCLVEHPRNLERGAQRLLIEIEPGARIRVTQQHPPPQPLAPGMRVGVAARVREPRNFENPGAFDYRGWLARRHIYWLASATGEIAVLESAGACRNRADVALARIRAAFINRLEGLYPDNRYDRARYDQARYDQARYDQARYDQAMMAALLLGDTSALEEAWTEPFRRTGVYHLLVVSGAHVSLLAGILLVLFQRLAARSLALLIACLAAWFYAFLAGGEAPVLRAAAGFSLFLFTAWLYRRTQLLNVLAVVTIAFLAVDPPQLREASFILSFGAVAALGALAVPLGERLLGPWSSAAWQLESVRWDAGREPAVAARRVELRLAAEILSLIFRLPGRWSCRFVSLALRTLLAILQVALATVAIQTALALPMVGWFHRLSFTGVPANLLATFPVSVAIPAGFLALLAGWPWLAAVAAVPLHASAAVADWFTWWEPELRIPDPPAAFVAAFLAGLATLCVAVRATGALRRWAILGGVCVALGGCCFPLANAEPVRGWFSIDMLDVGDGDALFLQFPNGATAVLDTGGLPSIQGTKPRLDIGEDVLSPYLWSRGLWRLDLAILSHSHADHAGGLRSIAANFRPAALWTGSSVPVALPVGAPAQRWQAGDTWEWGEVRIRALSPARDASTADANAASLVLLMEYGAHRFLFPGDLDRRGDRILVEQGVLPPVDVLKVAHHGGASASTEEFLAAVQPKHALISTAGSQPGRPHPRVLASLHARGARIWRTDQHGMISVRSDGHTLDVHAHGRRADRTLVWPPP